MESKGPKLVLSGAMLTNRSSLEKARKKMDGFVPPYCAKADCPWHMPRAVPKEKTFQKWGVKKIQRWPYINQRYRCNKCRKVFLHSFFTLSFRDKKNDIYEVIHDLSIGCVSGRALAELLKIDEDTVRRKKKKLCRWGLLFTARDLEKVKIKESVAYDGLRNFAYSQFDPNDLNHAVGRESLFIYDFNLSPLNRAGRISERQRTIKKKLEEKHGKYRGGATQADTKRLFERLLAKVEGELHIHSDNHYAYRRAIAQMKGKSRVVHAITPAKVARNFRNRLFAINHTDMLARHQLGTFKRETIGFAKTTIGMMENFILLATHKNYLRARFKRKHVRDPKAHTESPAMAIGVQTKILTFKELYRTRISIHHVRLNVDWQNFFRSVDATSRREIRPYAGI